MAYKLSLIIPVYNAEKYLYDCLQSVVNQTISKEIEIIIVNDGSTDNSESIIDIFKNNKNVRVLSQKNQGVVKARINGYAIATGDYIAWMDNDDIASPNMYQMLYNEAVKKDSDIVICDYYFIPNANRFKRKWFNPYRGVVDWKFVNHNTVIWNKLIKRSYLDSIDFMHTMLNLGEAAFTMLLINTKKISTVNHELYGYRVGHGSQSGFSNTKWYIQNLELSIRRRKSVIGTKLERDWTEYLDALVISSYIQVLIVCAHNGLKDEYHKFKKSYSEYSPKNSQLSNLLLKINNGILKFIVLKYVSPYSYWLTRFITKVVL